MYFPHQEPSLLYTYSLVALVACQAGDADTSGTPGLTSGFQGPMNVLSGSLLFMPHWMCINSLVFYILVCHSYINSSFLTTVELFMAIRKLWFEVPGNWKKLNWHIKPSLDFSVLNTTDELGCCIIGFSFDNNAVIVVSHSDSHHPPLNTFQTIYITGSFMIILSLIWIWLT